MHVEKSLLFGPSIQSNEHPNSIHEPLWAKALADFLLLTVMLIESQVFVKVQRF